MSANQSSLALFDNRLDRKALPPPEQPNSQPSQQEDAISQQVAILNEEMETPILFSKKSVVVLQGIFFSMHFHGEEMLKTTSKHLDDSLYNRLKNRIEDQMQVIDEKYKIRDLRGASSWESHGSRTTPITEGAVETEEDRTRDLTLRIFPRSFLNKLSSLRGRLTNTRLEKCITIVGETSGRYKQNIYILPYANAPSMIAEIAEVNKDIDELNKKIEEYLQSNDFKNVENILKEFHMESILKSRTWHVGYVTYEVMPLALNPTAVMEMVKTARGTLKQVLKDEERIGMELLQSDLERRSREMIAGALATLQKEVEKSVAKIVAGIRRNPERVKAELDNIHNKAESIGLSALAESVITPLKTLIDNPEKAEELFGTRNMKELAGVIDGRIRGLVERL